MLFHLSLVLSQKPALILVDEVIHLLDPYVRELFLEALIEAIAEMKSALLMVNHTFSETERLPERVLLMDGGRFILDEKSDSLHARVKKLSQEPAAGVPVLFSKETGPYREYYVYPFDEEFKKKYPAAYQDIGLPEIMKALIGGTYVEKRDQ